MTKAEALKLAKDAFGPAGAILRLKTGKPAGRFSVGVVTDRGMGVLGRGKDWRSAFEDAARHMAKQAGE